MSRFQGRQGRGALRAHRALLRIEAEDRAAETEHGRTKSHRLGKCPCSREV